MVDLLLDQCLTADRRAPGTVRALLRESLGGRIADDDGATVELVLCELVTNAVLHVGGTLGVRLELGAGLVRVSVSDSSSRVPVVRRAMAREHVSGRGMYLVDRLSRAWGAEPDASGKRVWSELEVRPVPVAIGSPSSPSSPSRPRPSHGRPW